MKYFNKILIFFLTISNVDLVFSQMIDIKLICQIGVTRTFGNGVEKEQVSEIFSILQTPKDLAIIPSSSKFVAATTDPNLFFLIRSDENRWDLTNKKEGHNWRYIIDRNTGKILYFMDFRMATGRLLVEASGDCQKIDTNKKVF